VAREGSSDYKKVRKKWFFMASLEESFEAPLFVKV